MRQSAMRINYDAEVDAAYIRVVDPIEDGASVKQVAVPMEGGTAEFILDFDSEGSLLGIEVLGARYGLRRETLEQAEPSARTRPVD
jgi:uncharacterized protein YuzE